MLRGTPAPDVMLVTAPVRVTRARPMQDAPSNSINNALWRDSRTTEQRK